MMTLIVQCTMAAFALLFLFLLFRTERPK